MTFIWKRLRLIWEFNLYWKFMCTHKSNDKNKTNLPPPSFHSSYSFLNCWKTTNSMTLEFSDFQFNVLWKIKHNCISGLFCIAHLLEEGKKTFFKNFMDFNPLQTKMKLNNPIINVLIEMTLKLAKSGKAKKICRVMVSKMADAF